MFVNKIVSTKELMLARMLKKREVPLRPGFVEVLQAAVDAGAVVAAVAGEPDVCCSLAACAVSLLTSQSPLTVLLSRIAQLHPNHAPICAAVAGGEPLREALLRLAH